MEEVNKAPSEQKKESWFFKKGSLTVAFLLVGPFMLPLVWVHPRMERSRKVLWTVVILVLTYFLVVATMDSMKKIGETYQQLKSQLPL